MQKQSSRVRSAHVASAAASLLALGSVALAAPSLISSSATIVHAAGFNGTQRMVSLAALPSFASVGAAAATPLQLPLGLLGNATTNSTAKAGVGAVTSDSFLGVLLAPATGVAQKGNAIADAATASTLTIAFSAQWMLNAPLQNASPQAGASFNVAGSLPANPPPGPNVPSPTAFFSLAVLGLQFDYTTPLGGGGSFRAPINNNKFLFTNIQGPFALGATDITAAIPSTLPAGSTVSLSGTFRFSIHNDGDEASLDAVRESGTGGPGDSDFLALGVPAPGAATMLALGGLAAARRRRA